MTKFTAANHAAIQWYCDVNNSVPQLSAWPNIRLMNRDTKEVFEGNVNTLTNQHKKFKKEASKEAARQKRMLAR